MKTVTFYSYKGGVGRTLLLANIAKYLARFGQNVFAIDFDLEAPGLHYKLNLDKSAPVKRSVLGLADYVHGFATGNGTPGSLGDYVIDVEKEKGARGAIHLMPAGDVHSPRYWRRLAEINWHDLFYSETAKGVAAFLDLKARIEKEFRPDYLLIDSRTGVTEIGGVATTILPDYVICLLLNNQENLDGAREAIRSIARATRQRKQEAIEVIPVLARIPASQGRDFEATIVSQVRDFLNEDAEDLAETLHIEELDLLHTDRQIEVRESLLIVTGLTKGASSPLFHDYIRLITRFVPKEALEPYIEPLVKSALEGAWDDPDGSEQVLTALAEYSAHHKPFEALVKFHVLRKADKSTLLQAAARYWEITGRADDTFLQRTVRANFDWDAIRAKPVAGQIGLPDGVSPDFLRRIWSGGEGPDNAVFGANLARAFLDLRRIAEAVEIALGVAEMDGIRDESLAICLRVISSVGKWQAGLAIMERYRKRPVPSDLLAIWAKLTVSSGDPLQAVSFLDGPAQDRNPGESRDWAAYARLQIMADRGDRARAEMRRYVQELDLRELTHGRPDPELIEMTEAFGLVDLLEERVRRELGPETSVEVLRRFRGFTRPRVR
jgi:hypothetical protein